MTLAPYHVPWALSGCTLLLLALSLCWLVIYESTVRTMARLKLSDGIALWLSFTGAYHTIARLRANPAGIVDSPAILWTLWVAVAVYAAARLLPGPWRREAMLLALALAVWAWTIGAGYQYLERMQHQADTLELRPDTVLADRGASADPLRGALALSRLGEARKRQVEILLRDLGAVTGISTARKAAVGQVLFPEILEHFRRDLSRLRTYQVLQILLLCAVLLAWGFGRKGD